MSVAFVKTLQTIYKTYEALVNLGFEFI